MKKITVTMLLIFGLQSGISAQKFLDRLQSGGKQGEGTVTISQSKDITDLVNGRPVTEGTHGDAGKAAANAAKNNNKDSAPAKVHHTDAGKPHMENVADNAENIDARKKVMRNARKVTGYRVQVFSGGNSRADKVKANNIGSQLKASFPNLPVYVHFYSPRWICRMGNFRSYQDAERVLKDVKAMGYGQACIVKGQITVHN